MNWLICISVGVRLLCSWLASIVGCWLSYQYSDSLRGNGFLSNTVVKIDKARISSNAETRVLDWLWLTVYIIVIGPQLWEARVAVCQELLPVSPFHCLAVSVYMLLNGASLLSPIILAAVERLKKSCWMFFISVVICYCYQVNMSDSYPEKWPIIS